MCAKKQLLLLLGPHSQYVCAASDLICSRLSLLWALPIRHIQLGVQQHKGVGWVFVGVPPPGVARANGERQENGARLYLRAKGRGISLCAVPLSVVVLPSSS